MTAFDVVPVDVIIVHHGAPDVTVRTVEALRESRRVEVGVTLIDNGPGDGAGAVLRALVGRVRDEFPRGVRYSRAAANLGYGGGVNAGFHGLAAREPSSHVFFMNHDVVVEPDTLRTLVDTLECDHTAAAAGPVNLFDGDDDLVWNAGSDIEWPAARPRSRFHRQSRDALPETPYEVGYLAGCAILMRASRCAEFGPFAEDYFLYFEDADLGERIRRAGLRSIVNPRARVRHRPGSAVEAEPGLAAYYRVRNRILFSRRWGKPRPGVAAARLWFMLRKLARGGAEGQGARDGRAGRHGRRDSWSGLAE